MIPLSRMTCLSAASKFVKSAFKRKLFYQHLYSTKAYLETEMQVVDMRSDTITVPSDKMRQAMADAVVGDDVFGEDPTVKLLQERVAKMFQMEAGLFVPTGTMGNLISVLSHCWGRGWEVILGDKSHLILFEQGGISQIGAVHSRTLPNNEDGTFDLEAVDDLIRIQTDPHFPWTRAICVENTHNYCGGKVLTQNFMEKVRKKADEHDLVVHVDGARFLNAAVALRMDPAELLSGADSISLCFSKGLGAPVGSIIVGRGEFISRCLRLRKVLGGGMRQSGVLAAAAMVALDDAEITLQKDHKHAKMLAKALPDETGSFCAVDIDGVYSNIVMMDFAHNGVTAAYMSKRLEQVTEEERGSIQERIIVKTTPISKSRLRFVTHCGLSEFQIKLAIKKLLYVLKEYSQIY